MTKEDLLYEWNINRLKKHELSLFWELVDDPRITIDIRCVSGAVVVSGETDKHLVGEWLCENIEQAIYWSKRSFMGKEFDNEWHLKEYSKSEPHVANGRHITHIFKDEFIGDATFLKEAAAAGKAGNDCGEKMRKTLLLKLNKENLAHMVRGTSPHYDVFENPLIKQSGTFQGSYSRWDWNYGFENNLNITQLWEMYEICVNSWK